MDLNQLNAGLISVSPQKMIFYAPYDRSQKRIITILNPTAKRLLFKIRSNAALNYVVLPNCGCIEPYNINEVSVSLNYFDFHDDRGYDHHFTVLYIRSPCNDNTMPAESILCTFKQVRDQLKINQVRIPIELQPNPICIPQAELDMLLPPDTRNMMLTKLPVFGEDHLKHLSAPMKRKKRCNWLRVLTNLAVIVSSLVGAFTQRHFIEELIYLHLTVDEVQF
ncbi:vesicle-associated membrane protein-associated protein A isoform X2 [Drosophila sulfurigaster albostrigata]|uniref:vesicle-associated membrane protein-associated protein A isoform X2 n=1 Tax=Drosophila sulfurigaster albostrigata TaxID=89887 RepID=UPI002D21BA63|nr:vesicle-associated membrane protein-associated protein A isoform X2 [Drosophila sulfurigaster albostrigata]